MNAPLPAQGADLARLREITAALECGDIALFEQKLEQMVRERDSGLFSSVGRITRELHQAVQDVRFDHQISQFAQADMPDACSRLDYVMQVSEKAAHHTLDLVEQSRGLAARMEAAVEDLAAARGFALKYARSAQSLPAFGHVTREVEKSIGACAVQLRENLSALAQAQEYQDLSGQVIRRVITLVRSVESALLELLRASGNRISAPVAREKEVLAGPAVPGVNAASSQQDADALLAELGF